jgi:hypothetical protein
MAEPISPALARAGIAGMTDNLPPGARLDLAGEFVRAFRPEIECRLLPEKPSTSGGATCARDSSRSR